MSNERKVVTLNDLERRSGEAHRKPYFDWVRHVVSLATASLTALIALQSSYLPSHPKLPILLASSWGALLATILLGILALRAEYRTPLDAAAKIRNMRAKFGDDHTINYLKSNSSLSASWHHKWAVRLMVCSFIFGLTLLCVFSIVNLLDIHA